MNGQTEKRAGRVHQISAVSNPRIKAIRALAMKKVRDEASAFLVEGQKLVRDAFDNGWQIDTLIFNPDILEAHPEVEDLAARARTKGADVLEVTEKVLGSLIRRDNPQMVAGVMRQQWCQPPQDVSDPTTVWIALDRIRDPGNLGTIIRSADAAGANGIILIGDTTDPYSIEASRASMGSIFNVPLCKMTEDEFITWKGSWSGLVAGTHLAGASDYRTINYSKQPVLLVMGNEQQGLTEGLAQACDKLIYIPMNGAADSLNLAIATGVMLFHMGKRLPPL